MILKVARLPQNAIPVNGTVLAKGEVTGHAHRLSGGKIFRTNKRMYFVAEKTVTLTHEEHTPVTFPKGIYEVRHQREYVPKKWRFVSD